ncbi:MAG: 2-oxo acid dehydrogenase subunit E2 [Halobacteriota archaeon]
MVHEFRLPDVGEGVSEGELISWLVEEGDTITEDQPLAEVETDKALVEIPSPVNGTVRERRYEPGDIIPVGEVFVTLDVDGEVEAEAVSDEPAPEADQPEASGATGRVFAAPSVRRLARELDVDIGSIEGTGPGGRIMESDVEAAATAPEPTTTDEPATTPSVERAEGRERTLAAPATRRLAREAGVDIDEVPASETVDGEAFVTPEDVRAYAEGGAAEPPAPTPDVERIPYRGVRRTIGQQMEQSVYSAPHVTHHELIEVDELVATRESLKPVAEEQGISLTYLPFVIKALIAALREHPTLNAELDEEAEEILVKHHYNIGIAVATDVGLMVPVLKSADTKGLLQLASESRELAQKARDREVTPDELKGSTITITNFGAIGGDFATPILNYPEVAIVGLGALKQRPVVEDGEVVARYTLPLSITIDHRIIDGAEVAAFASTLGTYLSDPRRLLLD